MTTAPVMSVTDEQLAELESAALENRYAVKAMAAIIRQQRAELERLRAENRELRGLISECAEYLNTDRETTIGHGSILHRKMIDAMEAAQCNARTTGGTTAP